MKLTAEDRNKPMEDWKIAEWHKFFKQNSTISKYWPYWKDVADSSPQHFLVNNFVQRDGQYAIYDEIKTVIYFLKELF